MKAKGWSNPKTTEVVLELLRKGLGLGTGTDWSGLAGRRIADVGTGRGHFCHVLGLLLETSGLAPADHLAPCDLLPESFEVEGLVCHETRADGRLPFDDHSLDAVVSIEVIEHVEDQFAFWRELLRIAKPGAPIVVTTPNTHNVNSRVRSLTWGFPLLFDPLPHGVHDPRLLGGHIHPVSPYFLAYGALRADAVEIGFHGDRRKSSAVALFCLLWPLFVIGKAKNFGRMKRKAPEFARENEPWVTALCGTELLFARTAILACRKPR
jgi:SAM-dependent methyltransferase